MLLLLRVAVSAAHWDGRLQKPSEVCHLPVSPIAALEGQLVAHKDAQLRVVDVHLYIILLDPERQLEIERHLTVCLCDIGDSNIANASQHTR